MIKIIVLAILIVINGLFSAAELAFLSIDKYDLRAKCKKKNKKALRIQNLLKDEREIPLYKEKVPYIVVFGEPGVFDYSLLICVESIKR